MSYCRFCGQSYFDIDGGAATDEEKNYSAAMKCTCAKGYDFRVEEKRNQDRKGKIEYIDKIVDGYKNYFEKSDLELAEESVDFIKTAAVLVFDEKVKKVGIFINEIKIAISKNSKGKIIFNLIHSKSKQAIV